MSTLRCIPASLAPRAKRDSKRSPSGSKRSRGPVPKGTRFSRLNSHAGFLTRNHKFIIREASAKLFSQINRVKNEGGLTRVAPLGVEAALSSERSVGERLLVYSTSRIAANPTTERSVMKHMSDLGLEDCGGDTGG